MLGKTKGIFSGFKPYSLSVVSTLSEKTFLDERMTMTISSEENAKLLCTYLYNHSGCKRALQSSTAQSGKK